MDNKEQNQEFNLDDILSEFLSTAGDPGEEAEAVDLEQILAEEGIQTMPAEAEEAAPAEAETDTEAPADEETQAAEEPQTPESGEASSGETPAPVTGDTIRLDDLSQIPAAEPADIAQPLEEDDGQEAPADTAEAVEEIDFIPPPPIVFTPRSRLRELKKKLVAGPEKRYYELTEQGVGKLQIAIFLNILIVILCAGFTVLFSRNIVPESRLRLVIFSQVLAMLVSGLLGCYQMLDGLGDLLKGRFTVNTLLAITFAVCCVDAVFCLMELRIPFCSAFSLEMAMALWARYHRRNTEMGQMDTMRKATRLNSLVKEPDLYNGRPGLLRSEGQVEDFMDNYQKLSGPEKAQCVYAFISFVLCIGIAVFAGIWHSSVSMAFQILSTSLLVAVPASFFVALTRPMSILERRLHMVGTVFCGWQGVKGLCGRMVFPLSDEDLFPTGSTKLNGVKFYGDRKSDEVVEYSAALIRAGGGGLVPVFDQLLSSRSGRELEAVNFQTYPNGGIGGEVEGEPVLLGTLNFLQDMGVEIPEGTMVSQAVYAAVDGQLCAVYAIAYAKMRSAAAGLVTLCGYRKITPVLTCGDFMLTDSFLKSKFGIKPRRVAFPEKDVRVALAARRPDPEAKALALTTREELVSSAYAVTGARSLRTASILGVILHILGGTLGMLIMLALAYLGSTELLTPAHILLYQLVWMVPGLLITEWTRTV